MDFMRTSLNGYLDAFLNRGGATAFSERRGLIGPPNVLNTRRRSLRYQATNAVGRTRFPSSRAPPTGEG